jgi:probable HAF family extracellular repeat protein
MKSAVFSSIQRCFLVVSALLIVGIGQARAERYKVTDLGALPGGSDRSVPHGINNAGQVVGESGDPNFLQGFLWENGTMTPLGFLSVSGNQTVAEDINDAGQVVGSSGGPGVPTLAFIWDRINGMRSLGGGIALGINGSGQVVGFFGVGSNPRAFLWDSVHGMQDIGYLPGGNGSSTAFAINDQGQVVGESYVLGVSGLDAFLWESATGMTDLGTLPDGHGTRAVGINNKGQVVGYTAVGPSAEAHAVLWDNGIPTDIGLGSALGINDAGQVVGGGSSASFAHGFIWDRVNEMRNLDDLIDPSSGWSTDSAVAINGKGEIAAIGSKGTVLHALLLTPVPESTKISIDIQPGSDPASINPKSNGKIPVAILTTDTFDATTVNAATVRFGAVGTEAVPVQVAVEDVNGDGRPDLLLTFNTPATGITCGATSASLTGETQSRQAIEGTDAIQTVGCK